MPWENIRHFYRVWSAPFCVGAGFALGFGWVWFPEIQSIVLPHVLWGSVAHGGGTRLFVLLLCMGFMSVSCLARYFYNTTTALHHIPTAVHVCSLACMLAAVLPPWPMYGVFLYIPVIFLACAALLQGTWWGGALLALTPKHAGVALAMAYIVAISIHIIMSLWTKTIALYLFCIGTQTAAWWLARQRDQRFQEYKRPRGRPPKTHSQPHTPPHHMLISAWGYAGILFTLGLLALHEAGQAPLAVTFLLPMVLGVCAVALMGYIPNIPDMQERVYVMGLFMIISALYVLLLLFSVWFPVLAALAPVAQGGLYAAAVMSMAGCAPQIAWGRAALALALLVLVTNAGIILQSPFYALCLQYNAQPHIMLGYMILIFPLVGCVSLVVWKIHTEREGAQPTDLSSLTIREQEILDMQKQGLSTREIAEQLFIQEASVRFHLRNIQRKQGE